MFSINRAVVIVKPKQPFVEWINTHPDSDGTFFLLDEVRKDCTAFLIPDYESDKEAMSYIKDLCTDIFEIELESWYPRPEFWPKKRDYPTFLKWFEVEIHSLVIDPYENEIEKDEY